MSKYIVDIPDRHKYALEIGIMKNGSVASKVILNAVKDGIPYVERPHGVWIGDTDFDGTCKCSICRMTFDIDRLKMVMCDGKYEMPHCCPNCGSDNRKKEDKPHGS